MPQTVVKDHEVALSSRAAVVCCSMDSGIVVLGRGDCLEVLEAGGVLSRERMEGRVDGVCIVRGAIVVCALEAYYMDMCAMSEQHLIDVSNITQLDGLKATGAYINDTATLAAVAYKSHVLITSLPNCSHMALLQGHDGDITGALFSSHLPATLVTTSEDRTFKVWDYETGTVTHKSSILSAYPIRSVTEQCSPHRLLLGLDDGSVLIVSPDEGYKELFKLHISSLCKKWAEKMDAEIVSETQQNQLKIISSTPPWKQQQVATAQQPTDTDLGHSILAIRYVATQRQYIVVTQHAILTLKADCYEVNFLQPAKSELSFTVACLDQSASYDKLPLVVVPSFTQTLAYYSIILDTDALVKPAKVETTELSVFLKTDLPRKFTTPLVQKEVQKKGASVVFHKQIKSSGYASSEPWSVKQQRKKALRRCSQSMSPKTLQCYKMTDKPPSTLQAHHSKILGTRPVHHGAVLGVTFTSDAKHLLTCSADRSVSLLKLPVHKHNGEAFIFKAHTAPITCCAATYSYGDGQAILSGSLDSTAMLWKHGRETPYLVIQKPSEIKGVAFTNIDKLAVVASGGKIDLHKYVLDLEADDLDRFSNRSLERMVHSIATRNQVVTCVACHNSFNSGMIFYGGSNKDVGVYDLVKETNSLTLPSPHERPVLRLAIPNNCFAASHTPSTSELFATSSPDGVIRLWDLRTPSSSIRAYSSHLNTSHALGLSFSPCMRYLASGSEDRCTYLYDLGTAKLITKVHTHTDVVSDVAFNPLHPQAAAVGFDGSVKFLADK